MSGKTIEAYPALVRELVELLEAYEDCPDRLDDLPPNAKMFGPVQNCLWRLRKQIPDVFQIGTDVSEMAITGRLRDVVDEFVMKFFGYDRLPADLDAAMSRATETLFDCDLPRVEPDRLKRLKDVYEKLREENDRPETPAPGPSNAKKRINARMLEKMAQDSESRGWTCQQWAQFLKCSKPSVVATETWQMLETTREKQKAEVASRREMEKRRR